MRLETWTGRIYLVLVVFVLLGYAACESRGTVLASAEEKATLPPDMKATRGGYRTHTFWSVGYMGGK